MFWLPEKLLYNFYNEWMDCCLIYVMNENYMYWLSICTLLLFYVLKIFLPSTTTATVISF